MAAGDLTKARRRPDGTAVHDLEPGDYTGRGTMWWVCLPSGQIGRLDDGWTVTVHDDDAITVTPSIFDAPDGWHGDLEHGVWREV